MQYFTLYYTLPAAVGFIVRWGVLFVLPLPAASFKYKRTYLLCSLAFVGYMAAFAGILTALFARGEPGTAGGELTYTVGGIRRACSSPGASPSPSPPNISFVA